MMELHERESIDVESNGWPEWKHYVLKAIETTNQALRQLNESIQDVHKSLTNIERRMSEEVVQVKLDIQKEIYNVSKYVEENKGRIENVEKRMEIRSGIIGLIGGGIAILMTILVSWLRTKF